MGRDVYKVIAETKNKINDFYELSLNDIKLIIEKNNVIERDSAVMKTISDAFIYGYAMGSRAEKARRKGKQTHRN